LSATRFLKSGGAPCPSPESVFLPLSSSVSETASLVAESGAREEKAFLTRRRTNKKVRTWGLFFFLASISFRPLFSV